MSNSSRGRGRRQYNNNNNNNGFNNNNDYYDQSNGPSILSRLGPGGGQQQQQQQRNYNNNSGGGNRGGHRGYQSNFNNNNNRQNFEDDLFSSNSQRSQPRGGGGGGSNRGNRGRGRGGFDGGHQHQDTQQRWRGNNRRQYTRKFVDEDIEMDSPVMDGQGIVVAVSGHPDGAEEKLLGFLQRKSKHQWEPLNIRSEQGTMYISVHDENTANSLVRMNGYNFGQVTLSIQKAGGNNVAGQQQRGGGRSNALEEFLQERWDAPRGFLNLDDLPQTRHSITAVISRLLMVAVNLFGNSMMTISFARNSLWSVKPLKKLPELFPGLQNLSIQDNEIEEFRSLDDFTNKFSNLTELMLMGNPIQTQYDLQQYQSEVKRRFPSIQLLDQQPVANNVPPTFGATASPVAGGFGTPPPPSITVPETRGNFFDQPTSQQATEQLLSQYFPLFDSNRAALADLYGEQSVFSVTVSRNAPYAVNAWGQGNRVVTGNASISQRLRTLPPTIHDLTATNVVVDALQIAYQQNVLLSMTIHGQLKEATGANGQVYSYSRVMMVIPSQPGSRAQAAGWGFIILQDSIVIHK
ncbi:hypothetical protein BDA99DRAFT_517213 [Phascolomyces articulosus]|uniref:NTF2 domain-containing protein n=1 Tax=Phascolomyces articulosus TaxID=60185 RepID=A0AAD5PD49_9FUNG|nr:hypothetical protein BDA99DRAFT_517213 [Phascolomyces articulosus]